MARFRAAAVACFRAVLLGIAVIATCAALVATGVVLVVRGEITEGAARIGDITVGGTLGFLAFVGVPAGALAVALYVLLGSVLPRGRAGAVALGLSLLVLAGARLEPLRAENFDFNLVGPDWLSLLSFTALAVFQGLVTWAVAGRLGLRPLPLGGGVVIGRVAAGVLVLVALPGFLDAVADILG